MAPAFVRGSYKVKFVLSILVIVLVVGAVGAVGYADVRDTVRSDTEETLRSASAADAEATSEGFGALAIHVVNFTTGTVCASTNQPLDGTPLSEIDEPWADPAALESVDPETIRTSIPPTGRTSKANTCWRRSVAPSTGTGASSW